MSNTVKFSTAVLGGFDKREVVRYIQTLVQEHREEREAYRAAADDLRRERDQYKEKAEQAVNCDQRLSALESETAALREQLSDARRDLTAKTHELGEVCKEKEVLQLRLEENEAQLSAFHGAKLRVADMELQAYQRAEAIEREALQNTEVAREMLERLIRDTRAKYDAVRGEAEATAFRIMNQLADLGCWFETFPRHFDGVDDKLDAIPFPEKPQVKEFVLPDFDEQEQPPSAQET